MTRCELFALPAGTRERRHGPYGYLDYRSYKTWLRDEFQFRCVFCLHRENWERRGWRIFQVDHVIPQSVDDSKICAYDNLLYLCDACNEAKSDWIIPDPLKHDYSGDYKFDDNGRAVPLSAFGELYIEVLKFNEPHLLEYRRAFLSLLREFENLAPYLDEKDLRFGLERWCGYPEDIPDLRPLKPKGNSRPEGRHQTYLIRLKKGEIAPYY